MKLLLVLSTVLITVISSLLMDYVAKNYSSIDGTVIFFVLLAFALNIGKFGIWGWIHKRYELSKSFPLTSLFFPIIFLISIWYDYTSIELNKVVGMCLILVGLVVMEYKKKV